MKSVARIRVIFMMTTSVYILGALKIQHSFFPSSGETLVKPGRCRRQNRNNLLNLTTKPRFRRSQPRSGRKPPVTSRSSV